MSMPADAFCLLFLGVSGIIDYRKKSIPLILPVAFGLAGIVLRLAIEVDIKSLILGLVPGIAMVLISLATAGGVGMGDGCAIVAMGIFLGFWGCTIALTYALVMAGIAALVLIIIKKNNKYTMPFLPFLLTGYVLWLAVT